jgi:hypothetical protein
MKPRHRAGGIKTRGVHVFVVGHRFEVNIDEC